ncbi:hypothetical protein ACFL54_05435 [Planctomycetota bacterium]
MKYSSNASGIVLIVVVGVLALLSVLAITFVIMTRLELSISQNYVDQTRANLTAESGIEYAIARIMEFRGGVLTPNEQNYLEYKPTPGNNRLENAVKASFQVADQSFPVSGFISTGTYKPGGDYFILKVEDESGKLNLNDSDAQWNRDDDPDPDDPETDPDILNAPYRLRMIVQNLGEALFNPAKGASIAIALFQARAQLPGRRFNCMKEVHDALVNPPSPALPVLTEVEYDIFAKHVTLNSWQDPNVIRPTYSVALTLPEDEPMPGPGDEYGISDGGGSAGFTYQDVEDGIDSIHIYLTRDLQTKYFELEPRCPVNINTASLELLQAILTPLAAWYLEEGPPLHRPRLELWKLAFLFPKILV